MNQRAHIAAKYNKLKNLRPVLLLLDQYTNSDIEEKQKT